MKKILFPALALVSLSACSLNWTHDSTTISQVKEVRLNDSSAVKVGYKRPDASWKCLQLDRKTDYTATNQFKGMFKLGGAYQVVEEQAIEYANQKHLKTNYIFLYVPSNTEVNNFNLSPFSEAEAVFYQCKNTPAVKDKLF